MSVPSVELRFNPTDLRPRDLPAAGAFLGSPGDALEAAMAVARAEMQDRMRNEIQGLAEPTQAQLLRIADLAWQATFWNFRKVSAPVLAEAYVRAYRRANAGDVPMSVIYTLADKHVEKIGDYFHATSRDALAEGFSLSVNRRLPAKAAANKALEGWGLSPRQMRGYMAAKQLQTPVDSPIPMAIKARVQEYVNRAFTTRTRKMSRQEEHNIDQQAQQFAWMWLQEKGRLNDKAQKLWITAKDERVCPVCGPLHGKRVGINERFLTAQGEFWTPVYTPNCRCVVRLIENRFSKADWWAGDWNPQEHPRGNAGRFTTKTRTLPQRRTQTIDVDEEFAGIVAAQAEVEPDMKVLNQFEQIIAAQPTEYSALKLDTTTAAPISLATPTVAPTVTVSPFQVRTTTLDISPAQAKLEYTADLVIDMRTQVATQATVKADPKTPTRPVEPAWALVTHDQLQEGRLDRINLNHGIEFDTDDIGAAQKATQVVEQAVEAEADRLKKDARIRTHDAQGNLYYADVSPEVIDAVVDWTAKQHTGSRAWDPHTLEPEPEGLVAWHRATSASDEGGGIQQMSFHDIGDQLGIDRENFQVYLVELDEIHDPEFVGEASYEQVAGSIDSKQQRFSVDGEYQFNPSGGSSVGYHGSEYSVSMYKIVPFRAEEE